MMNDSLAPSVSDCGTVGDGDAFAVVVFRHSFRAIASFDASLEAFDSSLADFPARGLTRIAACLERLSGRTFVPAVLHSVSPRGDDLSARRAGFDILFEGRTETYRLVVGRTASGDVRDAVLEDHVPLGRFVAFGKSWGV